MAIELRGDRNNDIYIATLRDVIILSLKLLTSRKTPDGIKIISLQSKTCLLIY